MRVALWGGRSVSKKPKRIRAVKAHIDQKGGVATTWEAVRDDTPYAPCYILRQSDIRAMAEQMAQDFLACGLRWNPSMLYALKRAGMTPGKGNQ